ncbi:general secretion pathway protein GspB [Piscinibacter sakaiensis]|uniref:general secretion pathway protein GspB n=1 Tax=Piscinibacter sakaiensis TaxID=1547922 RepID=UPI0018D1D036|nr:general secretion pathway protein GspB [Piscinibacter sakaiensis]
MVSGTVYASEPAQRLVIVNGELLREGARIGPDLVVEEIRRKDVVWRYRGQRFSLGPS